MTRCSKIYQTRQLKDTALEDVPDPTPRPGEPKFVTNLHSVSTDEDLKTRIRSDLKATVPLEGALVHTENSYLSSVKTSDTSLTRIIQETITYPPSTIEVSEAQLSSRARTILEGRGGWPSFTQRYGEYFVYGYVSRAHFSAICSVKTSDKKVRDEVQTSLDVGVEGIADVGPAIQSVAGRHNASISISVDLEVTGLQSLVADQTSSDDVEEFEPQKKKTNKLEDVQTVYDNFRKNFKPQPYTALLCHYSVLDTEGIIPLPVHQFDHLGKEIEGLYKNLYTAQVEVSTSPMVQASETSDKIADVCSKISNFSNFDLTQEGQLSKIRREAQSCLEEVDLWRLRSSFIGDVVKLRDNNLNWG